MVRDNEFRFSIIEKPNFNLQAIWTLKDILHAFYIYLENIKNVTYYLIHKAGFTYDDLMFKMEWYWVQIYWEQLEKDLKEEAEQQKKQADEQQAMYAQQQQQQQQMYKMPQYQIPSYN